MILCHHVQSLSFGRQSVLGLPDRRKAGQAAQHMHQTSALRSLVHASGSATWHAPCSVADRPPAPRQLRAASTADPRGPLQQARSLNNMPMNCTAAQTSVVCKAVGNSCPFFLLQSDCQYGGCVCVRGALTVTQACRTSGGNLMALNRGNIGS